MTDWRRPVAAIATLVIATIVFMVVTDMGPRIVLVGALGVLLGVTIWSVSDLSKVAYGTAGIPSDPAPPPSARADRRVTRLRSGLAYGRHDDGSLERLRDSLVELIDDQLLVAHDIDRASDPDAAAAILDADLLEFVTDERTARLIGKPRQLDTLLARIEAL